jgi:branched-subunit amino acid ABC-type transport system permease component
LSLLQIASNTTFSCLIVLLVATAFAMTYGVNRTFDLHLAGAYAVGSHVFVLLYQTGFPSVFAITLAVLASGAVVYLVEVGLYARLRYWKADVSMFFVLSLALYMGITATIALFSGVEAVSIQRSTWSVTIGAIAIGGYQFAGALIGLIVCVGMGLILTATSFGLACQSVACNAKLATTFGVPENQVRSAVAALAGSLAGLAGAIAAGDTGSTPYSGFQILLVAASMVLIWSSRTVSVPWQGFVVVSTIQAFVVWTFSDRWKVPVTLLMMLVALFFSKGSLGSRPLSLRTP